MLDTAEKLPLVRFIKTAEEDRVATDQYKESTGKSSIQYMDVVKVYIRAPGDLKTEIVDIAEKLAYDGIEVTKQVEKEFPVVKTIDGEAVEVMEKNIVPEKKTYYEKRTVNPWLDKQKERLHHNKITQNYYDYCIAAFDRFKKNEDQPINGTPLALWRGAPESVKIKAIECGILSVEAAAEMNSEAISNIGLGAHDLKQAALKFVSENDDLTKTVEKLEAMEKENAAKDERMSALEAKLAELTAPPKKAAKKTAKKTEEAA